MARPMPYGRKQGSKTFGNLEPGSPNAIFEFQEFEMQFLEARNFFVGAFKNEMRNVFFQTIVRHKMHFPLNPVNECRVRNAFS